MAVTSGDLKFYLTALTGGKSLGGAIGTAVSCGTAFNVFDLVTGPEGVAGTVDYRCVYLKNESSQTAFDCRVWVDSQVAGGATVTGLGVDPNAASSGGSSVTIASETTAPAGVTFSGPPTDDAGGLVLGDLTAGQCRAFWVRRQAGSGPPVNADGATLRAACDTEE